MDQMTTDKNTFLKIEDMRVQLEGGMRFIHQMEVQGRVEQTQLAIESSALVDLLIAKGIISMREFDERLQTARQRQTEREMGQSFPTMGEQEDKYSVTSPDIPCAELLHLCRAACCNMVFSLSLQDLEEGKLKWNYAAPYRIRQDAITGKCVHFNDGCDVYDHRPNACRKYDCRNDSRIWEDFAQRIPAENVLKLAPVPVVGGS
jgi:Fe-S-cluster containining protein